MCYNCVLAHVLTLAAAAVVVVVVVVVNKSEGFLEGP
jgi:hypothetical protein